MIRPGEPWGTPTASAPDLEVHGDDARLAAALADLHDPLVRFRPDETSDLARAVGLPPGGAPTLTGLAVALDALRAAGGRLGCNMIIVGAPPERLRATTPARRLEVRIDGAPWFAGRATTVVVANGQFHRGRDLVPRGHPGDGRLEVQVYALRRAERAPMRARLAAGAHVPHPRIHQRTARHVEIAARKPLPCELDLVAGPRARGVSIEVVPAAYRLLL